MIEPEEERERGGQDLATSTLAEIYAQQGLLERARAIYERIAERAPDDSRIAERIEDLSRAIRERSRPAAPVPRDAELEVRDRGAAGGVRSPQRLDETARDEAFEAWLANRQ